MTGGGGVGARAAARASLVRQGLVGGGRLLGVAEYVQGLKLITLHLVLGFDFLLILFNFRLLLFLQFIVLLLFLL